MAEPTVLFRARVPAKRLKRAEKVLARLGLKPGDALNMLLAQIELHKALPFDVTTHPTPVLSSDQQAEVWAEALGGY